MKTCLSLVKIISDGENNFIHNKCNKWMKHRNVFTKILNIENHKNANMELFTVYLHGVDLMDMQIQD